MRTLLLTDPLPSAPFAAALRAVDPDIDLLEYRADLGDEQLATAEALLAWRLPPGVAGRLPRLRWVCSIAAGVEKLLVPELSAEVPMSRIVDAEQAGGIAQFAVLMALRHARGLPVYEAQQRERSWQRQPMEKANSRVVVLGTGTMGAAVVDLMGAVGFAVTGWNRRSGTTLAEVLATAEIVVCALPLTSQTEAILDARAFAAMPRGAYLINIARGAHVVEADLIEAVRSGALSGAALDVQRREPLPPDDPLWTVPGITITPHIAASSGMATIAGQYLAGLRAVERGEPPPNQVDRQRGY